MKLASWKPWKPIVAVFGVALALVFTHVSAMNLLNGFEHRAEPAHMHDDHGALHLIAADDHSDQADAEADDETTSDADRGLTDHPGHHHHVEAPTGFASAEPEPLLTAMAIAVALRPPTDTNRLERSASGLERPPKALTTTA